jgi:hypothetical protein
MLVEFNPIFDNEKAMATELTNAGFQLVKKMGTMNQLWENAANRR